MAPPIPQHERFCILQDQDVDTGQASIRADVLPDGSVQLTSYWVNDDPDPDEPPVVTDCLLLLLPAWRTLVQMYLYRYPADGARLAEIAQGWTSGKRSGKGEDDA